MKEVVLLIAVFGVFVCGYFLMGKWDKFLEENRKVIENESEKRAPSCVMLTDELSDEDITKEIRLFREKHSDTKILLFDFSDEESYENCDHYIEKKK